MMTGNTSVLGIDPTFNLGDFYVTVTTYENLMLNNRKTAKHPVFIGPMLVHQKRTYDTYYHFASEMLKYRKEFTSMNVIGTDGEEQLRNAFGTVFPGAVRLLCSLHKRDNIKTKLRACGVSEQPSNVIMKSIFGYQVEETFYTGLIDAEDIADFSTKLEELRPKWDSLCPDFYPWFVSNESDLFITSMIRSVRSNAGLGFPPRMYTTNNNESINRVLKDKVCYKKQEWPQFNLKMYELVKEQEEEFSKAVCGCGEYELCEEYKFLEVSNTEWVFMTPEQRKAKINKVMKQGLKNTSKPVLCGKPPDSVKKMSVDLNSAHVTHLQPNRVADLWKKAEEILNIPNFIVPAAGCPSARQVASVSGVTSSQYATPPHFVYSKKCGRGGIEVHCDCAAYRSAPNICQHSLAAAEDMGVVGEYLVWVRKTKATSLNLSNLISKEVPKSSGQKGPTSRRKGTPKGKKKAILAENDGIVSPSAVGTGSSMTSIAGCLGSSTPPAYLGPDPSMLGPSMPPYSPFSMLSSPPPFYSPSPLPAVSYCNQPTFNSQYYCYPPHPSDNIISSPPASQPVFNIKHLEGTRIRSCYGCGSPIRKDLSYIPPPPHDLVVSHKERRYYKDPNTHEMRLTSNEDNTHYHLMLRCITQKHPAFKGWMLQIPDNVMSLMDNVHRMHFFEQFGLHV